MLGYDLFTCGIDAFQKLVVLLHIRSRASLLRLGLVVLLAMLERTRDKAHPGP
jgi:hypothetical protein